MKREVRLLELLLVSIATLGFFPALYAADESVGPPEGKIYLTPGLVYFKPPKTDNHEAGGGIALGYSFTDWLAAEIFYAKTDADVSTPFGTSHDDAEIIWANALYKLDAINGWRPFTIFGVGSTEIHDFDDTQINAGVGVYRNFNRRVSLRGDVRAVYSDEEGGFEPMAFLGLSIALGSLAAAPPPAPVDADADGVADVDDRCPSTPRGRTVGPDGCQLDDDRDGVIDNDDKCPDTPTGATVDPDGCPLDSDGDGVPDYLDECPDTERGARVDSKGCYILLERDVTIDLNLEFDTNSGDLRDAHAPKIQEAVDFLRLYPTANADIEGHTDSRGSESYNQSLSEKRAKSVHDYLVDRGGIRAARLSYVGKGELEPIASNDNEAGRQSNRRVSVVVRGTQTVRQ